MNRPDIDQQIRDALSNEDAKMLAEFGEDPSLLEVAIKSMTSRYRTINLSSAVVTVLFVVFGFYSAWQFFQATELKDMIAWSLSVMFCTTTVSMLKVWYWLLMNRYEVTREIKRLELQVARMGQERKNEAK